MYVLQAKYHDSHKPGASFLPPYSMMWLSVLQRRQDLWQPHPSLLVYPLHEILFRTTSYPPLPLRYHLMWLSPTYTLWYDIPRLPESWLFTVFKSLSNSVSNNSPSLKIVSCCISQKWMKLQNIFHLRLAFHVRVVTTHEIPALTLWFVWMM
jgi:hypothetical protein